MSTSAMLELGKNFARVSVDAWDIYKKVNPASEALAGVGKSISMASSAAAETLQANDERIEELRSRLETMTQALQDLARNKEDYWLLRSGGNWLSKPSLTLAKAKTSEWIEQFTALSNAVEAMLPLARGFSTVMNSDVVQTLNVYKSESSLALLDSIAAKDMEGNLNSCKRSLKVILACLRNCLGNL